MTTTDADFEAMVVSSYSEYVHIIRTFSSHEGIVREFEWRAMCLAAVAVSRWLASDKSPASVNRAMK